jgi:hypothetical protein
MQKYIITQSTFDGYEDLSVNIEATRLNVFIKKAQDLDLKPFFGNVFFYDLIKNLDEDGQILTKVRRINILELIDGTEYTDRHGNLLYFDGIKPALVYWTFARFIEADSVRYTATGPVIKHHDQADNLTSGRIAKLVAQQRSVANAHANDIVQFLDAKREVYPLWKYNDEMPIAGSRGLVYVV